MTIGIILKISPNLNYDLQDLAQKPMKRRNSLSNNPKSSSCHYLKVFSE